MIQQKPLKLMEAYNSIHDLDSLKEDCPNEWGIFVKDVKDYLDGLGLYTLVSSNKSTALELIKTINYTISKRLFNELNIDTSLFRIRENYHNVYESAFRKYLVYLNRESLDSGDLDLLKQIMKVTNDTEITRCVNIISSVYPSFQKTYQKQYQEYSIKKNQKHINDLHKTILVSFNKELRQNKKLMKGQKLTIDTVYDIGKKLKPYVDYITVIEHKYYKHQNIIDIEDAVEELTYLSYSELKNLIIVYLQNATGIYNERSVHTLRKTPLDFKNEKILFKAVMEKRGKGISEYSNQTGIQQLHHLIPRYSSKDLSENIFNLVYVTPTEHYETFHVLGNTRKINYDVTIPTLKKLIDINTSLKNDEDFKDNEYFDRFIEKEMKQMIDVLFKGYSGSKNYLSLLESESMSFDFSKIIKS
jgi:hypothetical protein